MVALDSMRESLNRVSPISTKSWDAITRLTTTRTITAGERLLSAGSPAVNIFFVAKGLLREYCSTAKGGECTRSFCQPGEFTGSLSDLLSGQPAKSSIAAIEAGELCQIPWAAFDQLTTTHPDLMLLTRRFIENLYLLKSAREIEMLTLTAAERYTRFRANSSLLESKLPRHLLASYLGITPVHLSRLAASHKSTPPSPTRRKRS